MKIKDLIFKEIYNSSELTVIYTFYNYKAITIGKYYPDNSYITMLKDKDQSYVISLDIREFPDLTVEQFIININNIEDIKDKYGKL